jgi:predicted metal-dependent hydrolase
MKATGRNKTGSGRITVIGLPVEIERKKIKNMYLKVLPPEGRLHVSAPVRMPEETIKNFILSKEDWIRLQQDRIRMKNDGLVSEPEYVSGDLIPVWGRKLTLWVLFSQRQNRIVEDGDKLILYTRKSEGESLKAERDKLLKDWYRDELNREIPLAIHKWEQSIGVKAKDYTIRDMKTRWGTCNVREHRICLNLQLAKKTPECLEYVVVHELVHLLERSHNKIFKAYMDRFLPGWRMTRARLNGREPLN